MIVYRDNTANDSDTCSLYECDFVCYKNHHVPKMICSVWSKLVIDHEEQDPISSVNTLQETNRETLVDLTHVS